LTLVAEAEAIKAPVFVAIASAITLSCLKSVLRGTSCWRFEPLGVCDVAFGLNKETACRRRGLGDRQKTTERLRGPLVAQIQ